MKTKKDTVYSFLRFLLNQKKIYPTMGKVSYFGYPDHASVQFDLIGNRFMMIRYDQATCQFSFKFFRPNGQRFDLIGDYDRLTFNQIKNYVTLYTTNQL